MIKLLSTIALLMHNFITNFVRILGICKDFAKNRVNELGNVPRYGVVPKFSDLEAAPDWGYGASQGIHYYGYKLHAVCSIRGVIHSYDMTAASVHDLHYLDDVYWENHDYVILGDKEYLSAEIQKNLFEVANITLEVPYRLNQKNWRPPTWVYKRFRKRIETVFSHLNDNLMMIRNYAKQSCGLFTRIRR